MAIRYAPVGPIAVLEALEPPPPGHPDLTFKVSGPPPLDFLGSYLLLIAHDVHRYPFRYSSLVKRVRARHEDAVIILDNGVIEHGEALYLPLIIEAAQIVQADYVAVPDKLRDAKGTLYLAKDALIKYAEHKLTPMLIPQGSTLEEVYACMDDLQLMALETHKQYDTCMAIWGIPRWMANELGSRMPIIRYAQKRAYGIHLLGTSQHLRDDLICTKQYKVIGIDSANPLVMGQMGVALGDDYNHYARGNYWDVTELEEQTYRNIMRMRGAIG